MRLSTHLQQALSQLMHAKLRSFLAVLGILVGTASVVAMVSISLLAENQILNQYRVLGVNLLSVSLYDMTDHQKNNPETELTLEKIKTLPTASPNIILTAPYTLHYASIIDQDQTLQGSLVGATPKLQDIAKLTLAEGRFLSFLDIKSPHNNTASANNANNANYANYAVMGADLAKQLHQTPAALIGQHIRVGDHVYTLIGVLRPWPTNFFFNTNFNDALIIPLPNALSQRDSLAITNLAIRIRYAHQANQTLHALKIWLQAHTHQVQIYIQSPQSLIKSMQKSSQTMTLLLALVGSISLIVGGIGIMNIMLVSVTERQKEIGLRLAVGARTWDIQLQFLTEAVMLSLFGGVAGTLLGLGVTEGVVLYSHWTPHFFVLPPILGCLVSILMGIFFGFYPAYKASQLKPIDTLRAD